MSYSMGQHLYNANYLPESNNNLHYLTKVNTTVHGFSLYDTNYRDLKLIPAAQSSNTSFTFENGLSYLLRLRIRRNTAYNLQLDLRLMNETSGQGLNVNQYEEIKRIYIPRAENFQYTSTVLLYEIDEQQQIINNENIEIKNVVCAGVLRDTMEKCKHYDVFQDKDPQHATYGDYFYKQNDNDEDVSLNNFALISQRSIISLPHTWDQKDEETFMSFDIVFSPKANNGEFNRIILELVRQTYDEDITFTVNNRNANDNNIEYKGLHIDETPIEANEETYFVELYQVTNLLGTVIPHSPITHLGVWSHPDLVMSINGEEIRVGPSGYYELNDYDITSLGIACLTTKDKFTIDYQYEIT